MKLQNVARAALRSAYDDLAARLPDQPSLKIDESPTRPTLIRAWVWAFVASTFNVFTIRRFSESKGHAKPIRCTNCRAKRFAESSVATGRRWSTRWVGCRGERAHLIRDMRGWIDGPDGSAKPLGRDLLRQVAPMLRMWWQVRDGTPYRAEFQTRMQRVRNEVHALLPRGQWGPSDLVRPTCAELLKHADRLWQFVDFSSRLAGAGRTSSRRTTTRNACSGRR